MITPRIKTYKSHQFGLGVTLHAGSNMFRSKIVNFTIYFLWWEFSASLELSKRF